MRLQRYSDIFPKRTVPHVLAALCLPLDSLHGYTWTFVHVNTSKNALLLFSLLVSFLVILNLLLKFMLIEANTVPVKKVVFKQILPFLSVQKNV